MAANNFHAKFDISQANTALLKAIIDGVNSEKLEVSLFVEGDFLGNAKVTITLNDPSLIVFDNARELVRRAKSAAAE